VTVADLGYPQGPGRAALHHAQCWDRPGAGRAVGEASFHRRAARCVELVGEPTKKMVALRNNYGDDAADGASAPVEGYRGAARERPPPLPATRLRPTTNPAGT